MTVPRMHDGEVEIQDDVVRRLVDRARPDLTSLPLLRLTTWGTDHVIYRLGDEYAVRLPKVDWAAEQCALESRWLPLLRHRLPVAVPVPVLVGEPGEGYPFPWCLSPWLDGDPVSSATPLTPLALDLAAFVLALQSVDTTGAPGPAEGARGGPLALADSATRESAERLRGSTNVDALLHAWAAGVDAAPWSGPARWVHGDLMEGNLLLQGGRLAAVLDWGGLKAGDPAVELMAAWSLFEGPSRMAYREALGFVDDAMWLRGRSWAVSAALMALPYYRDTNPEIVARSWRVVAAVLADLA